MKFRMITALMLLVIGNNMSYAAADNAYLHGKVGIVDVQKLLDKSPDTAKYNQQLTQRFKVKQQILADATKKFKAEQQSYLREQANLSPEKQHQLQQSLTKEAQAIQASSKEFQKELVTARNKMFQALSIKLLDQIHKVGKQEHYTVILDKRAVLYSATDMNLTDKVLTNLK